MTSLQKTVLQTFKMLHRTRLKVFSGDKKALAAARMKINEEFVKNKHVTDVDSIKAMVQLANEVEKELRTKVIQARETKPGVFEAKITKDISMLENVPYDDDAVPMEGVKRGKGKGCCQDK